MKTVFVYYTAKVGKPLLNGGHYVTLSIHKLVNNHPVSIGNTKYNSTSFRGEDNEVMNFLIDAGEIGIENRDTNYISWNVDNPFEIIKI